MFYDMFVCWQHLILAQKFIKYVNVNPFLYQMQFEHSELVVLVLPFGIVFFFHFLPFMKSAFCCVHIL